MKGLKRGERTTFIIHAGEHVHGTGTFKAIVCSFTHCKLSLLYISYSLREFRMSNEEKYILGCTKLVEISN